MISVAVISVGVPTTTRCPMRVGSGHSIDMKAELLARPHPGPMKSACRFVQACTFISVECDPRGHSVGHGTAKPSCWAVAEHSARKSAGVSVIDTSATVESLDASELHPQPSHMTETPISHTALETMLR